MFPPGLERLWARGDCSPIPSSSRSSANALGHSAASWYRLSCKKNRRAELQCDFSVGEMHYDRNSYPRLIGDGMSKLTGSVAEGCKQPAFQTRIGVGTEVAPNDLETRHGAGQRRHRWRGFAARAARWLTLLQTLRGKCPPARSLSAARRAGHLGAHPLSGHRRTHRQKCADLWCRYRRPSVCRATDKTGPQFRTSVDTVGRSGLPTGRERAGRRGSRP